MKKLVSLIAAMVLALTALTGCNTSNGGELGSYSDRPNEVVVVFAANAFGKDWITQVAKNYMDKHNSDTYVNVKQTVIQLEDLSKIEAGIATGDLYLLDCHTEEKIGYFEDISDVYESYPIGETEKTVREKLPDMYYDYFKSAGAEKYIMPKKSINGGFNFAYNKTVLDEFMPEGYSIPRTTDEFIAMGNALKGKAYLLVCSFGEASTEYSSYMLNAWFAQLLGYETYQNYMNGRYYDEATGKYIFDESAPTVYIKNKEAVKDYYSIIESIYSKENGYLHADTTAIGAMEGEAVLAGYGFGQNLTPAAFMVQGSYYEQEAGWMLEEKKAAGDEQEIGFMQIPIASAIIKRTPSIPNDNKLREVIDYVDKKLAGDTTAVAPSGVTAEDIAIIEDARQICGTYRADGMVVPKCASNKEGAKEFMRYLASDEAAVIAAKYTNGLNFLPFGKRVSEAELGFERSTFIKEANVVGDRATKVCSSDAQEYLFTYVNGFGVGPGSPGLLTGLYNGKNSYTAESFYKKSYDYLVLRWKQFVEAYKTRGGSTANA